ncbi:cupin domain-containing protein [Marinobacter sp. X15-166B]|uniref:cupin domain-containing protein n=1 Tax=Marinobacter sp. X15-166B TaxID=1897620 RepID=UPI00085BB67D|nr:cupin domain-containing protein [Marinobacter sp. X15-166B]OEY65437.1 transcriptional regulator [Marinobacter sp. X15-166B]
MTIFFRAAELSNDELTEKPLEQPTAQSLSGEITTRSHVFFKGEEQPITAGTWECEPGRSRWEFMTRGEVIHVLSGRMTVEQDGGETLELTAGSSAVFPVGWCGFWTVHETLRKVFVIYGA